MPNNKNQVIVIHGGDAFDSYQDYLKFLNDWEIDVDRYRAGKSGWKGHLAEDLGQGYDVILPQMPNKINAKYSEWKIWFEKFIPYLDDGVILVGHSMGGTFLAKYLAENLLNKIIKGLFLVAAVYDAEGTDYSLADFSLPESLSLVGRQARNIFIYASQDDEVVPFANLSKFEKQLPNATIRIFTDRGHFNQEHLPEIVESIKEL